MHNIDFSYLPMPTMDILIYLFKYASYLKML